MPQIATIEAPPQNPNGCEFPLVSAGELKTKFPVTRAVLENLRKLLPQGIYWLKLSPKKIVYNLRLLGDYFKAGNTESESHQKLVEEYQSHFSKLLTAP